MAGEFENMFITTGDKPALIACSRRSWVEAAQKSLVELGYKVHTVTNHPDFTSHFSRIRYEVVIIEELFAADRIEDNLSLQALQNMAVSRRRHAVIVLLGDEFKSFDPLQAFQRSVHAVLNSSHIPMLKQLTEKAVAENDIFLHNYREVQNRVARS